jgi:predicted component of type VI protein secretion system
LIELWVHAGLCNRMREMASALALARAAGQPLKVYWFRNKYLNCEFGRLFEPIEGVQVLDVHASRLRGVFSADTLRHRFRAVHGRMDLLLSNEKVEEYWAAGVDLVPLVAKAKRCVIVSYYSLQETKPMLGVFRPQADIRAEIEKAVAEFEPHERVGVHIRGTDNAESSEHSPVDAFLERMKREVQEHPDARFFLATDDPCTERRVSDRFPGQVATRPKVFARDKAEGVRDALVDLLILSQCRRILGSYWSSFTDMAADLGGADVEIIGGRRTERND